MENFHPSRPWTESSTRSKNNAQRSKSIHVVFVTVQSANVFLNRDETIKLGDMNVSKLSDKRGLNYTQTGTPYYASPEVWRDEPYDKKSDIWSLGCVLYETVTLQPPFRASDMQGLYKKVTKGHYPRIPKIFSHDLVAVLRALLQVNASSRPTCDQILSMAPVVRRIERIFAPDELLDDN